MLSTQNLAISSSDHAEGKLPVPDQSQCLSLVAQSSRAIAHALLQTASNKAVAPIRVLLAEPMGPVATDRINGLTESEAQVISLTHVAGSAQALTEAVADAMRNLGTDLLVVRGNCQVDQHLLEKLSAQDQPAFVLRVGTGMDNINTHYLDTQGIAYSNKPDINTQSTAELALGLMFAVKRKIARADSQIKTGQWNRETLTGSELGGKTLGIIGVGRIGGIVGKTAKALGMKVIGLPSARQRNNEGALPDYLSKYVSLDELCQQSDVLTLHVPLSNSTRGMIGEKQIKQLSGRNAVIVNTARGGIVDEAALLRALDQGKLGGAGIDSFVEDPAPEGSISDRLARHSKVVATAHVGGQTVEASEKMGDAVVNQAREMFMERVKQQIHWQALAGNSPP